MISLSSEGDLDKIPCVFGKRDIFAGRQYETVPRIEGSTGRCA